MLLTLLHLISHLRHDAVRIQGSCLNSELRGHQLAAGLFNIVAPSLEITSLLTPFKSELEANLIASAFN